MRKKDRNILRATVGGRYLCKLLFLFVFVFTTENGFCQAFMANIPGRKIQSLNGQWPAIIDWYDYGKALKIFKDTLPANKTRFIEYSFENGPTLTVPGDWNHQLPELKYFEGSVWYRNTFQYKPGNGKRAFIHFGGVSYTTDVYLNGMLLGSHEGGFTPFQFEVTDKIQNGQNKLILRVNNQRIADGIPALGFDWWNYGGIARDVSLIETNTNYINDYFIQLKKGSMDEVDGWVKLNGSNTPQKVTVKIPEAKLSISTITNSDGYAKINFKAKLALWSPENPKLYRVEIATATDTVQEKIGFRSIAIKGTQIILNGKPVFLKGVNFHEEISQDQRRAVSLADARQLLTAAKDLGCNFVRLAHYPQNEHTVRLAEEMGIMLWEEIPVWQDIKFTDPGIMNKANTMLKEMITRDKNRCGIIIWSLSNETYPNAPKRTETLINMAALCRSMDSTRLVSSAYHQFKREGNVLTIVDTLSNYLDVLAANSYMGWYAAWPKEPGNMIWKSNFDKPMIYTEFGGEALYDTHGPNDNANLWTEEYQEKLYQDNVTMFSHIPFLAGTCPWNLYDFRAPFRMNAKYQQGWNRKGLLSDKGEKKKAWYVMKEYYDSKGR